MIASTEISSKEELKKLLENNPEKLFKLATRGMLPKTTLGKNQLKKLGNDEKDLKKKIEKFKKDEINHKNIAYEYGATTKGLYSIMDKVIRTGSRIAITISEKI